MGYIVSSMLLLLFLVMLNRHCPPLTRFSSLIGWSTPQPVKCCTLIMNMWTSCSYLKLSSPFLYSIIYSAHLSQSGSVKRSLFAGRSARWQAESRVIQVVMLSCHICRNGIIHRYTCDRDAQKWAQTMCDKWETEWLTGVLLASDWQRSCLPGGVQRFLPTPNCRLNSMSSHSIPRPLLSGEWSFIYR